jgi:hypothetical protein
MSCVKVTITLSEKTLDRVDHVRGLIPRSAYIQDVIAKNLKKGGS